MQPAVSGRSRQRLRQIPGALPQIRSDGGGHSSEEREEKAVVSNGHNHVHEAVGKIRQEPEAPVGKGNTPQPVRSGGGHLVSGALNNSLPSS